MSAMQKVIQAAREHIDAKAVTVTELAAQCGCSRQHLYNILGGSHQPTIPVLENLATALGLEITVKKVKARKKVVA